MQADTPNPNSLRPKTSRKAKKPGVRTSRAPNPFILFRCDFVKQKRPTEVECDSGHRNNISRAAGKLWKGMTEAEKEPWVRIAGQERAEYFERRKRINRPAKGQKTPMTVGDISCVALPSSSMISDVGMNLTDDSPSSECRIGSGEPEDERTDIHIKLNDARIEKDDCSEPIDYAVELSPHNLLVVPREIDLFPELHSSLGIGNWSLAEGSGFDQEALFLGYSPMPPGLFPADMIQGAEYDEDELLVAEELDRDELALDVPSLLDEHLRMVK